MVIAVVLHVLSFLEMEKPDARVGASGLSRFWYAGWYAAAVCYSTSTDTFSLAAAPTYQRLCRSRHKRCYTASRFMPHGFAIRPGFRGVNRSPMRHKMEGLTVGD
jgi:hypothetical protein